MSLGKAIKDFDWIGNMLDPWGIFHKKTKPQQTEYMKRYYKAVQDYRRLYSDIVARKIRTPTQLKKLGLYDDEAWDPGVSMMGGGSSILPIPTGEIPILVPTQAPQQYVPSIQRTEALEAEIAQLQAMLDGALTPEKRRDFLRLKRKREAQLNKQKLALLLAKERGERGNEASNYIILSDDELNRLIEEARKNRPEQKDPADMDRKYDNADDLLQQRNESSDVLSDVEKKMINAENKQKIKTYKKGKKASGYVDPDPTGIHWTALRELIIKSLTDRSENSTLGFLLMFAGPNATNRTEAVNRALTLIGEIPADRQRLLDILSDAGINLIPPSNMPAKNAKKYVSEQTYQFSNLPADRALRLRISFSKLFRNLLDKILQRESLPADDRDLLNRLKSDFKPWGKLSESINKNQPEKAITALDFLNTENPDLLTTFFTALAETGYNDREILAISNSISDSGNLQTATDYQQFMLDNPTMDPAQAKIESLAITYNKLILELLTHIQNLNNRINSRFVRSDLSRNFDNVMKLKRTLTLLAGEIARGLANATTRFSGALSFRNIPATFENLSQALRDVISTVDSLTTQTTTSGVRMDPRDLDEIFDNDAANIIENEDPDGDVLYDAADYSGFQDIPLRLPDVDAMFRNPANQSWGQRELNRLRRGSGRVGRDLVRWNIRIFGNARARFGIGTSVVQPNWAGVPVALLREILSDFVQRQTAEGIMTPFQSQFALREIGVRNAESLYSYANTLVKSAEDRARLLREHPELRPRRGNGDPPDPDDGNDRNIIFEIDRRRRSVNVGKLVALLVLLGVSAGTIVEIINKARKGKEGSVSGTVPTFPGSDKGGGTVPTFPGGEKDIGTGGDTPTNNIPPNYVPPSNIPNNNLDPMFPNRSGNTDPIYGGIGNITNRAQPFKPIGQPTLSSTLGADYIQPDENMLKNSAIMKIIQDYNDDASRYNELIALRYDLKDSNQDLSDEEKSELDSLTLTMKNRITQINQQAPLVQNIGYKNSDYYAKDAIIATKMSGAFITTDGRSIGNVYPLIPTDDYTRSVGLDDDIATYNNLATEYNDLALKYKDYGKEPPVMNIKTFQDTYIKQKSENAVYVKDLDRASVLDKQLQTMMTKINAVMGSPESSVGREYARDVKYTEAQKKLIDKVANLEDWNALGSITEAEKQSLRDNPELYPDFERLMTIYNNKTRNGKDALSLNPNDPKYADFYRVKQRFVDIKTGGYKYSSEKAPLPINWKSVESDSMKEYVRSKQEFLDAVSALKSAKQNGLPSHQVSQLYNDLETKRLHYESSRQNYEKMADSYKHSLSGRTSFLANMTQERLPDTPQQAERFDRLQTIERVLMNNPDALKEYNDKVSSLGSNISIDQNYDARMDLLKVFATKYNLVNEYTDATTRQIDVKVPSQAEDPSTIVDFAGEGADDVGQSTERANFIDPSEATLFMTDDRQRAQEQKRWENFSLVQPWNGLGNPRTNPLLNHQVQEYMLRYDKADKAKKPTPQEMRQLPEYRDKIIKNREFQPNYKTDFPFIPTVQASFGREIWENEFAIPTNNFKTQKAIFSREDNDLPNNMFSTWYPMKGSIYHPDNQIDMNNFDESATQKLKTNNSRRAVFEGLPSGMNEQYGSQQVSQFGGKTMNNDFGNKPLPTPVPQNFAERQRRPNSVFDNLDMSSRRTMSMRRS